MLPLWTTDIQSAGRLTPNSASSPTMQTSLEAITLSNWGSGHH